MARRKRERVRWRPEFAGSLEGWTRRFCYRNAWRVAGEMDADDLYQECAIKFLHVRDTYPDVTQPAHFMRLYQVSVLNRVHDLARRKQRGIICGDIQLDDLADEMHDPECVFDAIDLKVLIESAPAKIRKVCEAAMCGKGGYASRVNGSRRDLLARLAGESGYLRRDDGTRETRRERRSRMRRLEWLFTRWETALKKV